MQSNLSSLFKRAVGARVLAGLAIMPLLAGCASTLSARVTTFQQWPIGVEGAHYRIAPLPSQTKTLEYQAFSDMIRAAIGRTGLVEAAAGAPARFEVSFDYGNPVTQSFVQQYNDPFFYNGFGPGYGPWSGYYGGYGGWGGGMFYSPPIVNVPVQVYKNTLTVVIKDNHRDGAEVYRTTAVNGSTSDNLVTVMPYLARAVFDGFPGNNGQVREISYERQR